MYNFASVRIDYYRDDAVAMEAFLSGAFDLRRELDPKKWIKMKEHPAVKDGRLDLHLFKHKRTEAMTGFVMNLRRPLMCDVVLRRALAAAFDFDWINAALLYGMGKRTESYFPNSELAWSQGKEEGPPLRDRLLLAARELRKAGYVLSEGKLYTKDAQPVSFEVMLSDPTEEKIALEWARALQRLGIEARVRTVDSAQYQERLNSFDYDVTRVRWFNSLSPGNEQMNYWSCAAAKSQGSRNYMGVCDSRIDHLAAAIPAALTRHELVEDVRKLDRALLDGVYVVPFYYLGADPIASFKERVDHPKNTPLYGPILESWWSKGG
jgi:microcin C transport system substrate-binding protein